MTTETYHIPTIQAQNRYGYVSMNAMGRRRRTATGSSVVITLCGSDMVRSATSGASNEWPLHLRQPKKAPLLKVGLSPR